MLNRRCIAACLFALILFFAACEDEGDDSGGGQNPETPQTQQYENPELETTPPIVGDEEFFIEGTPEAPPGWPPGSPYVVENIDNGDGTYSPVFAYVPGGTEGSIYGDPDKWQDGVTPQGHEVAIVNGQLHVLHAYDSDGDGLYDTMAHTEGDPPQGSPNIPDYTPTYPSGIPTSYRPPPPPANPTLGTPSWISASCVVLDDETRLFYEWTGISGAERYEMDGNFQLEDSSDLIDWGWIGFSSHTSMTFAGEVDRVRGQVRAAASGGSLSLWSTRRVVLCETLALPQVRVTCTGGIYQGTSQWLNIRWNAADGRSPVSTPIRWRIDGPDGTREGTGATGTSGELVNVGIAPHRYWRDYVVTVQLTVNGVAVLDPVTAEVRCSGTEPPLPSNLNVVCTAAPGSAAPLVEVSWDAPSEITVGNYEVEGDLTYTGVSTSFSRTGAFLSEYEVRVRAFDSDNDEWTGWTGLESGTCPIAEPANVSVTCLQGEIVASWTDLTNHPDTVFVVTAVITEPGSSPTNISETVTTTRFRRVGAWATGTTIELQVQASNGGTFSSQVAAPTTTCVNFPTGLNVDCAVNSGILEVAVDWDAVTGMTSYEVSGDLTYTGTDNSFTATGVYGQSYTVQVRGTDGTTTTGWSTSVTGDCPPSTPAITGIGSLTQCDVGDLEVKWQASLLVDTYEVELDDGTTTTTHPGLTSTVYQQSGVNARTEFDIRVKAVNASGGSPWSPTVTVECEPTELSAASATLTADTTPVYNRAANGILTRTGSTTATFDFDASWTRPADTYGCAVDGYTVRVYRASTPPVQVQSRSISGGGTLALRVLNITVEGDHYIEVTPTVSGDHTDCGGAAVSASDHTDTVPQACAVFVSWEYGETKEVIGNDLCGTTGSIGDNSRADDADDGDTLTSKYECTVTSAMSGFDWLLDNADGDDDSTNDPGGFHDPFSGEGTPCGLYGRAPRSDPPPEGWTTGALDYQVKDSDGDTAENTVSVEITAPPSWHT